MISLKIFIGIVIFLLLIIMALLIWIAVLRSDMDTLKSVNKWLNEDIEETNAKLKIAMGLPVDAKDETFPMLYIPRDEHLKMHRGRF